LPDGLYDGTHQATDPATINGWLISVLKEADGHVLHREQINRLALKSRLNLTSVTVYVGFSFALRACEGGGLYRLVGSFPTAAELEHATAVAEATRVPSELRWAVSDSGLDLSLVVGSNLLAMGSVPAPAALCRLWPDGGAGVECLCSRPFKGRVTAYGDSALANWNTLLTHLAQHHDVGEGSALTMRVAGETLRVLRID
jgi:hypothetical protein